MDTMDRDRQDGLGRRYGGRISPRLVLGFAVIAVGLLLTLDNLGVLEARHYWRYWPVVLIVGGLAKTVESMRECGRPVGMGLVVIGAFLLLANIGPFQVRELWPLFLLALGASIVWKALAHRGGGGKDVADRLKETIRCSVEGTARSSAEGGTSPSLSAFAVLGGVRRATCAQDFKRGDAFALMGGCELDLREASMKDDEAVFDIFALMGGVEMRVPEDWVVDNRGFALLGGFVDKTRPVRDAKKRLVLTGLAVMGGVEVKN
jgi:hypothetical protein